MVTPQGFNALLKIVEEPPAHVKFIFATTEPEKVIGTIRSRTHHYPFRLVPPAQMLEYLEELCASEKVNVAPGVLSLVVRSGGGSVRDSLSLLDQLIAGSEGAEGSGFTVEYERAAALLGFTHSTLLDEVVDAFAAKDASGVFAAVDKVIQTGQDPRRFVEDLLEYLRDLIVVTSVGDGAKAVLRGIPDDELDKMGTQALRFGLAELTHAAQTVNHALTEMSGATSPKLHLELMCAKVLVPSSDQTEIGSLARIERLERRIGMGSDAPAAATSAPAAQKPIPAVVPPTEPINIVQTKAAAAPVAEAPAPAAIPAAAPLGALTTQQFKDSWAEILSLVNKASKSAWMIAFTLSVVDYTDDVLTLKFLSQKDLETLKSSAGASDVLRKAIFDVLGVQVKFKPVVAEAAPVVVEPAVVAPAAPVVQKQPEAKPVVTEEPPVAEGEVAPEEPVAPVEEAAAEPKAEETAPAEAAPSKAAAPKKSRNSGMADESARYGESLLREMLGAEPIQDKNGGR
jgi:DNA polymerase-3 subunit gamma/tau